MARIPKVALARERHQHDRENPLPGFDALGDLYHEYWGEFLHLALLEPGADPADLTAAYQRIHERCLEAIEAPRSDAFSTWPAAGVRSRRPRSESLTAIRSVRSTSKFPWGSISP
jgi:hypothetical protein